MTDEELKTIASGTACDVVMLATLFENRFLKLELAPRVALETLMGFAAEVGGQQMPPTQLRNEGRHDVGHGKTVLLFAFKDGCHRVYGAFVHRNGRATFICTAIDDNKKQRKADQEVLARAAKKLKPYVHEVIEESDTRFDTNPAKAKKREDGNAKRKEKARKGRR